MRRNVHFQSRKSNSWDIYINDDKEIHPDEDKIRTVKEYPSQKNKKELKQMLGMAIFFARVVPNFAEMLSPLTSTLSQKKKKLSGRNLKNFLKLEECTNISTSFRGL